MSDIVTRLRDWEKVYPCDEDKSEGSLYIEAADRIEELEVKLEKALIFLSDAAEDLDGCAGLGCGEHYRGAIYTLSSSDK